MCRAKEAFSHPDKEQSFYSNISSTQRLPIFVPEALSIVLIARAVFPCFPITFPISLVATRNSKIAVLSPSTSATVTSSGLTTKDFAISSISVFISTSISIQAVFCLSLLLVLHYHNIFSGTLLCSSYVPNINQKRPSYHISMFDNVH